MDNLFEDNWDDHERPDEVARVIADFQDRTLSRMEGNFNRLIYVASLRDYNTGRYHHYGLETRYSSEAVSEGLCRCHAQIFDEIMELSLEEQTQDLVGFFGSLKEDRARLVETWQRLRAYQILPPENCHAMARGVFNKNVEIMLKVLRETVLWDLLHDPHGNSNHLT